MLLSTIASHSQHKHTKKWLSIQYQLYQCTSKDVCFQHNACKCYHKLSVSVTWHRIWHWSHSLDLHCSLPSMTHTYMLGSLRKSKVFISKDQHQELCHFYESLMLYCTYIFYKDAMLNIILAINKEHC